MRLDSGHRDEASHTHADRRAHAAMKPKARRGSPGRGHRAPTAPAFPLPAGPAPATPLAAASARPRKRSASEAIAAAAATSGHASAGRAASQRCRMDLPAAAVAAAATPRGVRPRPAADLHRAARALTKLLRHDAPKRGLRVAADFTCAVADVLRLREFRGLAPADVATIAARCRKRRFKLSADGTRVGATQGHSFPVSDDGLAELTEDKLRNYPVVVHGTSRSAWPAISARGLSPMKRQHVHLATGEPGADGVVSGMRRSAEVLVYVDVRAAKRAGIRFFVSDNGVVLTRGNAAGVVPPEFFSRVVHR